MDQSETAYSDLMAEQQRSIHHYSWRNGQLKNFDATAGKWPMLSFTRVRLVGMASSKNEKKLLKE